MNQQTQESAASVRCPIENPDLYDLLQAHGNQYAWLRKSKAAPLRTELMEGCEGLRFLACANESAWLRARRCFITASEAADLTGDGYGTAYRLFLSKTQGIENEAPEALQERWRMGHRMEAVICDEMLHQWGNELEIEDPGDYVIALNTKHPRLACTLDRLMRFPYAGRGIPAGLWPVDMKVKTFGDWSEGVDDATRMQLVAQAEIVGTRGAVGAGHIKGVMAYDFVENHIGPIIGAATTRFFDDHINTGIAPGIQTKDDARQFQILHPDDTGETVTVDSSVLAELDAEYLEATGNEKDAVQAKQAAQGAILGHLEQEGGCIANFLTDGGPVKYSWKTQTRAGSISVAPEHEEALKAAGIPYKVTNESSFRVLRRHERKEKK